MSIEGLCCKYLGCFFYFEEADNSANWQLKSRKEARCLDIRPLPPLIPPALFYEAFGNLKYLLCI